MARKFKLEISEEDLKIIDMALQEIPYRVAKGVLERINQELIKCQMPDQEQEKPLDVEA